MTSIHIARKRALAVLLALGTAATVGIASQAAAADLACHPDVFVTNKKGASIKVISFRYTIDGKEETEGLANKRLSVGEKEQWLTQKLQHAASGRVITSTRVEYKDDTSGKGSPIGDPYGPPHFSPAVAHSEACVDKHDYSHVIE